MTSGDGAALLRALAALDRRARAWSVAAWRARGRADIAFGLAGRLIELARAAGDDVPAGTPTPSVAEHAIADVLTVLGQDLAAALAARPDPQLEQEATRAVRAALRDLDATVRRP